MTSDALERASHEKEMDKIRGVRWRSLPSMDQWVLWTPPAS